MFSARFVRRLAVLVGASSLVVPVVTAAAAHAVTTQLYVSASAASDPACADASQANPFATIAGALACAISDVGAYDIGGARGI